LWLGLLLLLLVLVGCCNEALAEALLRNLIAGMIRNEMHKKSDCSIELKE